MNGTKPVHTAISYFGTFDDIDTLAGTDIAPLFCCRNRFDDRIGGGIVFGNHDWDYGDPALIMERTKRPSFYVDWVEGISLLVLNTNLFWFYPGTPPAVDFDQKQAQLDLIRQVCDTISTASHLVILHHHGLFRDRREQYTGRSEDVFNVDPLRVIAGCDPAGELSREVYPWLVNVQQRGVQVVLVGGDLGMRTKTYALEMPEGIWLLGSGINNSVSRDWAPDYVTTFEPDSVLIFEHDPERGVLEWRFVDLDGLVK